MTKAHKQLLLLVLALLVGYWLYKKRTA